MPLLRSVAITLGLGLGFGVVAPLQAQPMQCNGTVLQLQVQQQGSAASDRFDFNLGLEAEAPSKTAALDQLNARLAAVRRVVAPLASGKLTIPAPSTYRSGGGSSGPVREQASTSVSGVVSKANYDALIQAAGRLPGVSLRGFTAEAAGGSEAQLQTKLLRAALADGRRQAQTIADALGLRRVQLLRIDQRGGGLIRPMPYAMAARSSFNPDEARPPESTVSLALDYCLA
ncbi:SIMPL domain-containing protein [Synechococcus sp. HJ21-Hayes]|uniref:SIMPL domain-containing protein n=1 Tax=unclassified Synechococcus TaxID=2626047 RepID=UPI0020CECE40|nr:MULTISPECIES: SIMPL domain-containing protein [unclassified Synechococcus]MCP9830321.1 SIMPL domain-containing protein [Synechococcus sp. JJ3a-Johnson]MCP9852954.1 SIMPL domain-containing protein [Synechococcus sp. HJ21-Hayes]